MKKNIKCKYNDNILKLLKKHYNLSFKLFGPLLNFSNNSTCYNITKSFGCGIGEN